MDEIIEALEKINENLGSMNTKLQTIEDLLLGKTKQEEELENSPIDVFTLLSLPDHLRKTATAIIKLGEATAEAISANTERTRSIESSYLNTLMRMGHIKKKRDGKKVVFYC